jgi:uncharacterized protein involved in outer membrane biogenesis
VIRGNPCCYDAAEGVLSCGCICRCSGARKRRYGDSLQTTLLSIAIALILALLTALVGPIFVPWGNFRTQFEAAANRLTGFEGRIGGAIDVRILPTPLLVLQQIEFGPPGDVHTVRARTMRVEFALAAFMRGELRAADVRFQGAELTIGLDSSGRLVWREPAATLDADAGSIQSFTIEDSRVVFTDAASDSRLELDKFEFSGEVRSLAGPVSGTGAFVMSGQRYPYRVVAGRAAEDGTVHIRLNVDPLDRPMAAEADASLWIEQGRPHFNGTLQFAHAVGRASRDPQGNLIEPTRITGRLKGDSAAAALEQIEFQYGLDDRAIKLRGDARLTFGQRPQLEATMSSPQIDLDRVLALPEATRRRPLSAIKSAIDYFADNRRLSIPVRVRISADSVTLGGAPLQRLSGDLASEAEALDIRSLDFRAPGLTQMHLSGRLTSSSTGVAFAGPVKLEAGDPQKLVAWLTDRADAPIVTAGPLRAGGEVKLGSGSVAVERFIADVDRLRLEGRLSYSLANVDRPSRLDAVLSAPDIDLDRTVALARSLAGDAALEWPREGSLALKIGRAVVAGVEAKNTDINMRLNADRLEIERFALADFGGAALVVTGRIDVRTPSARGAVTLDLDARTLDGVAALMEKFSSQAAERLRRVAERLVPAKLHGSLVVEPDAALAPTSAKLKIDGTAGGLRTDVLAEAGLGSVGLTPADLAQLSVGQISVTSRVDAGDGGVLVELLGLDRLVVVDQQPGRFYVAADGPLDGDLLIDSRLSAGGLDLFAKGTLRLPGQQGPSAGLAIKLADAKVRVPHANAARPTGDALPTTLTARLTLADNTLGLSDLSGKVADSPFGGQLRIRLAEPMGIDGQIELDALDLPAAIATALGVAPRAAGAVGWSPEPFESPILGGADGKISVKAARVSLARGLVAKEMGGILKFGPSQLAVDDINGVLAGGRLAGAMTLARRTDGIAVRGQFRLTEADPAELLPGDGRPPLSGWLTLALDLDGTGRSPVALIGALRGSGTYKLQDGGIARLDPAAFEVVTRAVDQGLPIEAGGIKDRIEPALADRGLAVPLAEGAIVIAEGQLRVPNTVVHARGADLAVSGSVDLNASTMDARLQLLGPATATAASGRPELVIGLNGPIGAPKRALDVNALASWLALRAVEQQAKRLNALGSARDPSTSTPTSGGSPTDRPTPIAPMTSPPAGVAPPP